LYLFTVIMEERVSLCFGEWAFLLAQVVCNHYRIPAALISLFINRISWWNRSFCFSLSYHNYLENMSLKMHLYEHVYTKGSEALKNSSNNMFILVWTVVIGEKSESMSWVYIITFFNLSSNFVRAIKNTCSRLDILDVRKSFKKN